MLVRLVDMGRLAIWKVVLAFRAPFGILFSLF
jgi:hypothetical protein